MLSPLENTTQNRSYVPFEILGCVLSVSLGCALALFVIVVLNVVEIGLAIFGVTLPWR